MLMMMIRPQLEWLLVSRKTGRVRFLCWGSEMAPTPGSRVLRNGLGIKDHHLRLGKLSSRDAFSSTENRQTIRSSQLSSEGQNSEPRPRYAHHAGNPPLISRVNGVSLVE